MKKTFSIIPIIAIFAIVLCCSPKSTKENGDSIVSNFEVNQIIKGVDKTFKHLNDTLAPKTIYARNTASIQWLTRLGNYDLSLLQDSLIAIALEEKGSDIDSALVRFAHRREFAGPGIILQEVDCDSTQNNDSAWTFYYNVNATIIELSKKIVSYKITNDIYAGGAHPLYTVRFINYDVVGNRLLSFNDVFKSGCEEELLSIVKQSLCRQYYVDDISRLDDVTGIWSDEIFVSNNFYVSPSGITFVYNPYDIAPWSTGVIEVFVYKHELDDLFTPDAITLFDSAEY